MPKLVSDANTDPGVAELNTLGTIKDAVIFTQNDGDHGVEVWRTNGTETFMLKDINPGEESSRIGLVESVDGKMFFTAFDGAANSLWITDGTSVGTVKLRDVQEINGTFVSNGKLYFGAYNRAHGSELWRSDGTPAGTQRMTEIGKGGKGCNPLPLSAFNGSIYFAADGETTGRELWQIDGTRGTAKLTADITPGIKSSLIYKAIATQGHLFFVVNDPDFYYHQQLWTLGKSSLRMVASADDYIWMARVGNTLYYTVGDELWRTTGSREGTKRLAETGFKYSQFVQSHGDRLLVTSGDGFFAIKGDKLTPTTDEDFYGHAPTEVGHFTYTIKQVEPGEQRGVADLWRTDRNTGKRIRVFQGVTQNIEWVLAVGSKAVFLIATENFAPHGSTEIVDFELWTSDGTLAGTKRLKSFPGNAVSVYDSSRDLYITNDILYLPVEEVEHGLELWQSDGTVDGTHVVRDIFSGTTGSDFSDDSSPGPALRTAAVFGDRRVYLSDQQLRLRDNASQKTAVLHDKIYDFSGFCRSGDTAWFIERELRGVWLWKTDGTIAGTVRIAALGDEFFSAGMMFAGKSLYFILNGDLWKSDGTAAGTHSVQKVVGDSLGYYGNQGRLFGSTGERVIFAGEDSTHGLELWISDGTKKGTKLLKDIYPGSGSALTRDIVDDETEYTVMLGSAAYNGVVYFPAKDYDHGYELWQSDGTSDGTFMVKDLFIEGKSSLPQHLRIKNGHLFFDAEDLLHGRELWKMVLD